MKHVITIGNGTSGISTSQGVRKINEHRITVISSETNHSSLVEQSSCRFTTRHKRYAHS